MHMADELNNKPSKTAQKRAVAGAVKGKSQKSTPIRAAETAVICAVFVLSLLFGTGSISMQDSIVLLKSDSTTGSTLAGEAVSAAKDADNTDEADAVTAAPATENADYVTASPGAENAGANAGNAGSAAAKNILLTKKLIPEITLSDFDPNVPVTVNDIVDTWYYMDANLNFLHLAFFEDSTVYMYFFTYASCPFSELVGSYSMDAPGKISIAVNNANYPTDTYSYDCQIMVKGDYLWLKGIELYDTDERIFKRGRPDLKKTNLFESLEITDFKKGFEIPTLFTPAKAISFSGYEPETVNLVNRSDVKYDGEYIYFMLSTNESNELTRMVVFADGRVIKDKLHEYNNYFDIDILTVEGWEGMGMWDYIAFD
jgi:hypothetical protein